MKKFNKKGTISLISISFMIGLIGTTTSFAAGPAPVNLLSAGNFVVLAKSGISTTGTTLIVGDIGVSPVAATFITGFSLNLSAESPFSTSPIVVGKVYASDYTNPTPVKMTTAISDMETAYIDASGRTNPTATELGAGNIGGLTIAPGLYKWGTGVTIPTDVTLSGSASDIWIFQIAQNLDISSSAKVILSGGAQANNIFWVVSGQTTLGTNSVFNGNILDQTAIVLNTRAKLNGRALAQTAVTLDANSVTLPSVSTETSPSVVTNPIGNITPVQNNTNTVVNNGGGNYTSPTVIIPTPVTNYSNVNTSPTSNTSSNSIFGQSIKTIATNIKEGNSSSNVKTLQEFLISQNRGPHAQALAKVGSTAYFGKLTRSALAEFQAQVGINPALGNFGSITRAYLSSH